MYLIVFRAVENRSSIEHDWIKNAYQKMHFFIEKIQIFNGNWSPKGPQRDPKIEELGGNSGSRPWTPPGEPNGTKMDPKWSQNGAKMEAKSARRRPEVAPRALPKKCQKLTPKSVPTGSQSGVPMGAKNHKNVFPRESKNEARKK